MASLSYILVLCVGLLAMVNAGRRCRCKFNQQQRTGEPDEEEGTFRSSIRREFGETSGVWECELVPRSRLLALPGRGARGGGVGGRGLNCPAVPPPFRGAGVPLLTSGFCLPSQVCPPAGGRDTWRDGHQPGPAALTRLGEGGERRRGQRAGVAGLEGSPAPHPFHPHRIPLALDASHPPSALPPPPGLPSSLALPPQTLPLRFPIKRAFLS
ncbi:hypothetical protein G4228_002082 [Cervus hanglu yarkandensis]|nr:hypothetical protein G4228_002082 [Cervus hanglu yarkandensis]